MAYARAFSPARPVAAIAAMIGLVVVLLLTTAEPAIAKPTIADIEKQITAADNKLEPIIEDYDRVHALLATNKSKAAKLETTLVPLQLRAQVATARIGQMVASVYRAGPTSTLAVMVNSTDTLQALNTMTMLNAAARQRLAELKPLLDQRDKFAKAKQALDVARAQLTVQNADLTTKKNTIETQLASLQKLRQQVYGTSGAVGALRPVACPFTITTGPGAVAARKACTAIGKPYVWAAAGPNTFDCSGLTLWAWAAAGKTLRHYTKWQWEDNTPVSRANLRPGDLVFFFPPSLHHMAIYVGGDWVVHAPHTGDYVRMAKLDSFPIAGFRRP